MTDSSQIAREFIEQSEREARSTDTRMRDHAEGRTISIDSMISDYAVTEADVKDIKETKFIYKKMIPRGHLIAIVGLPGSGKTTILEFVCGQIDGNALYITADISAGDVPEARRRSIQGGYKLLCPDIKVGKSMDDIMADLAVLSRSAADLTDTVIVIDTLKKITEVISKGASANIYKMLRSLTGRGATVICLGHCNKYPDQDGWPIYEGTSDLRSDFDELALLHAFKGNYGEVTTSLYWEDQGCPWAKARSFVEGLSWFIDVEDNRKVIEAMEWTDTVAEGKEKHEALQTADVIREVHVLLTRRGPMKQGDIVQRLSGIHGERVIKRVLARQAGKAWDVDKGEHNAKIHTAIADAALPAPRVKLWGKGK